MELKESYTLRDLAEPFEKPLGQAAATDLVEETRRALSLGRGPFSGDECLRFLEHVSKKQGLVGIVGGLAAARLRFQRSTKKPSQ